MKLEENCLFWDSHFRSHFQFDLLPLLIFWFSSISRNMYTLIWIKFDVSIFIRFGDITLWIFPTQVTHTHYCRPCSKNQFFWTQRTSKHINQMKIQHWKFWPNIILPLPNESWVMEVKNECIEDSWKDSSCNILNRLTFNFPFLIQQFVHLNC